MANVLTQDFDSGTNGSAITSAAISPLTVSTTGTGAVTYTNAWSQTGSLSAKCAVSDTTSLSYIEWDNGTAVSPRYFEFVFDYSGSPPSGGNLTIFALKTAAAGSLVGQIVLDQASDAVPGSLKLQNAGGSLVGSKSASLSAGPVRLEVEVNGATLTARGYFGANVNGATADWTAQTTTNTQSTVGTALFGRPAASACGSYDVLIDHIAIDDATWVGPISGTGTTVNPGVVNGRATITTPLLRALHTLYPNTDISMTGWTITGGASASVVLADNNDGTYIDSPLNPSGALGTLRLDLTPPPPSGSIISLTMRGEFLSATSGSVACSLCNAAGTVVDTQTITLSGALTSYTVTFANTGSLTTSDYTTGLQVKFSATAS